jgi:hypothetical protein
VEAIEEGALTADDFVDLFTLRVFISAIRSSMAELDGTSSENMPESRARMSAWYQGLDDIARESVRSVIVNTAHAAAFGALAVIDGVRHVGPDRFELIAVTDGERELVNPESADDLHETFQALVMLPDGTLRVPTLER